MAAAGTVPDPPAGDGPWGVALPPGSVTGVGSMPGTDPAAVQARLFDLLPDLPHLVELPDRGPGADLTGRGAALLVDLPVDLQPSGWRLVGRPGRDLRRARDLLEGDLDALAEAGAGYTGPVKVQAAGPWTLAATLELPRGDRALADPVAVADLAASLAAGLAEHVARVRQLLPGATLTVQLDEPALPAVLAGHVPTASGFSVLRTPPESELSAHLAGVLRGLPAPGVHCCAAGVPVRLLRAAGAAWISLDGGLRQDEDALGEALEGGTGLMIGAVDSTAPAALAARLALPAGLWTGRTVLSPGCGLAGRSPQEAADRLRELVRDGRRLAEGLLG